MGSPSSSAWTRGLAVFTLLRLTPFDETTAAGRSRERHRRILLSTLASATSRGISFVLGLVTVPLTLNYLGRERFGLWATVTSGVALFGFTDLGFGNGLVNRLAEATGREDREDAIASVSSACFILGSVGLVLGGLFLVTYPHVNWNDLFNVGATSDARDEIGITVAAFAACFLLTLPVSVSDRVHLAYQESFISAGWGLLSSALTICGLFFAVAAGAGLPWFVAIVAGSPLVAGLLDWLVLFGRQRPWLRPRVCAVSKNASAKLARTGGLFAALSIAAAVGYQSDYIVIAAFLGPEEVSTYAVAMRLFVVVPILLGFLLTPLWPAYRESLTRGDVAWVKRTLKRSFVLAIVVATSLAVPLAVFADTIIRRWLGSGVAPSRSLVLGLAGFVISASISGPVAMFLNGLNVVRFQIICSFSMAAVNLALSIILVQRIGVAGPIYGTLVAQVVCILCPSLIFIRRWMREAEE